MSELFYDQAIYGINSWQVEMWELLQKTRFERLLFKKQASMKLSQAEMVTRIVSVSRKTQLIGS